MAYIQRNAAGDIVAVHDTAQSEHDEHIAIDSPELLAYLAQSPHREEAKILLSQSDSELVRVIEDLIYTLIDKKVILLTDLPYAAREKLSSREKIRDHLHGLENLMSDDEGLL